MSSRRGCDTGNSMVGLVRASIVLVDSFGSGGESDGSANGVSYFSPPSHRL